MKGPEMKPVSHRTKLISFSNIPILCQMPNSFFAHPLKSVSQPLIGLLRLTQYYNLHTSRRHLGAGWWRILVCYLIICAV